MLSFRIKYNKAGLLKFTSHLDMNRIFIRAINRAGIDILYSEGFNPHPKMVFASPLSLGIESFAEYLDIKTGDGESAEKIMGGLKKSAPAGVEIVDVYVGERDFKYIESTEFEIYLLPKLSVAGEIDVFYDNIVNLFASEKIMVDKKSKTKTESADIKRYISTYEIKRIEDGYIKICTVIKTNSTDYLNPDYIVKAVEAMYCGENALIDNFIKKVCVYDINGSPFK